LIFNAEDASFMDKSKLIINRTKSDWLQS